MRFKQEMIDRNGFYANQIKGVDPNPRQNHTGQIDDRRKIYKILDYCLRVKPSFLLNQNQQWEKCYKKISVSSVERQIQKRFRMINQSGNKENNIQA